MEIHLEEVALAREYAHSEPFEELSEDQIKRIMDRGRVLYKQFKAHPYRHNLLNLTVIVSLLAADYFTWIHLPGLFIESGRSNGVGAILLAALVTGMVHSWLMYSLGVFSLHEGAAHKIIFAGSGSLVSSVNGVANNICRIAGSEPEFYSARHMSHHAKFGTEGDGEFLNFVSPRRYWLTFVPLAAVINFSDFIIHRPPNYTRGRRLSAIAAFTYHGLYAYLTYRLYGTLILAPVVLLITMHAGFYLDRLRQFTEHNLMPLDNRNGSRSFGLGFWGMLIGGGPWGSPCHWEHHLVASIPWYQQLVLHRYVVNLLTPKQRDQFLIEPVIGFPKLWFRLLRDSNSFLRSR